jgi:hypothetical protein
LYHGFLPFVDVFCAASPGGLGVFIESAKAVRPIQPVPPSFAMHRAEQFGCPRGASRHGYAKPRAGSTFQYVSPGVPGQTEGERHRESPMNAPDLSGDRSHEARGRTAWGGLQNACSIGIVAGLSLHGGGFGTMRAILRSLQEALRKPCEIMAGMVERFCSLLFRQSRSTHGRSRSWIRRVRLRPNPQDRLPVDLRNNSPRCDKMKGSCRRPCLRYLVQLSWFSTILPLPASGPAT